MSFVLGVVAVVLAIVLFTYYAPQIEKWNNKHLLSRGKKS